MSVSMIRSLLLGMALQAGIGHAQRPRGVVSVVALWLPVLARCVREPDDDPQDPGAGALSYSHTLDRERELDGAAKDLWSHLEGGVRDASRQSVAKAREYHDRLLDFSASVTLLAGAGKRFGGLLRDANKEQLDEIKQILGGQSTAFAGGPSATEDNSSKGDKSVVDETGSRHGSATDGGQDLTSASSESGSDGKQQESEGGEASKGAGETDVDVVDRATKELKTVHGRVMYESFRCAYSRDRFRCPTPESKMEVVGAFWNRARTSRCEQKSIELPEELRKEESACKANATKTVAQQCNGGEQCTLAPASGCTTDPFVQMRLTFFCSAP